MESRPRPAPNSGASGSTSAGATPSRLTAEMISAASSASAADCVEDMGEPKNETRGRPFGAHMLPHGLYFAARSRARAGPGRSYARKAGGYAPRAKTTL